jgi:[CysO sulfur-carrier protein]-S-L-cysteine hydrolase
MRVRRAVIDAMIAHARAEAPLECCGLLVGGDSRIEECQPARNLKHSPVAYLVDPQQHFEAIRKARRSGRAVVGAYHSHPDSPAIPSPTDVAEAYDPTLLYVIVSLQHGAAEVRAYQIETGNFSEVSFVPEP